MGQCGKCILDMGTYLIFETVVHFELLTAAELMPRCRTGVAWVGRVVCESVLGVVGLTISRISSSCVLIGEDRTALSTLRRD